MSNKVIDSFSYAASQVLELMLDIESASGPKLPGSSTDTLDGITVAVGLTGDISGDTYFYFHKQTALEIVKIMSGMEIEAIDDFVTSAMGEISNIISGNAATVLSEQKITCDILPPRISAEGGEAIPEDGESAGAVNTTLHTSIGDVDLVVIISR